MASAIASALTERAFADRRQREWDDLDTLTRKATHSGLKKLEPSDIAKLSPLYRSVCADLAAAEAARYSAPLAGHVRPR